MELSLKHGDSLLIESSMSSKIFTTQTLEVLRVDLEYGDKVKSTGNSIELIMDRVVDNEDVYNTLALKLGELDNNNILFKLNIIKDGEPIVKDFGNAFSCTKISNLNGEIKLTFLLHE